MTLKVVEAREGYEKDILGLAKTDPVLNVFIVYDSINLWDRCSIYVALDRLEGVKAACVVYHDRGFDSIIFCGSKERGLRRS